MKTNEWERMSAIRAHATGALAAVTAAGIEDYVRQRHLPRVLPVGPDEIADDSVAGRRRILARLARALRAERNRGRAGHWTYDLNRHIALRQAYLAEHRRLDGAPVPSNRPPGAAPPGG